VILKLDKISLLGGGFSFEGGGGVNNEVGTMWERGGNEKKKHKFSDLLSAFMAKN